MAELIQIITTTDSDTDANAIAQALLESKLAACVSITSPIKSMYLWNGKPEESMEWQCIIKTRADLFDQVAELIRSKHSYDIPEIVAIPVVAVNQEYLDWIENELE